VQTEAVTALAEECPRKCPTCWWTGIWYV
jgi:hypothetical protein